VSKSVSHRQTRYWELGNTVEKKNCGLHELQSQENKLKSPTSMVQWQAQVWLKMESLVVSSPLSSLEGNATDQAEHVGRDSIYSLYSDMLFMAWPHYKTMW